MKHLKIILIFISLFTGSLVLKAQDDSQQDGRRRDWRADKISFITERLNLTTEEAQKFWPVYNEYDRARFQVQMERGTIERTRDDRIEDLSDREITRLTQDYADSFVKEGELMVKYNQEFLKILPPEKVMKLYPVEADFRIWMVQRFQDRFRDDDNSRNNN